MLCNQVFVGQLSGLGVNFQVKVCMFLVEMFLVFQWDKGEGLEFGVFSGMLIEVWIMMKIKVFVLMVLFIMKDEQEWIDG